MTDYEPLTEDELQADSLACYHEAVQEIGMRVRAGEMELPEMFRPAEPESFWTPERVERLHLMRSETSMSFTDIAAKLGCTKNAAVGRLSRDEQRAWTPPIRVYPFDDMTRSQCCFPLGNPGDPDFHFCRVRVETEGRSYCDEHHQLSVIRKVKAEDLA